MQQARVEIKVFKRVLFESDIFKRVRLCILLKGLVSFWLIILHLPNENCWTSNSKVHASHCFPAPYREGLQTRDLAVEMRNSVQCWKRPLLLIFQRSHNFVFKSVEIKTCSYCKTNHWGARPRFFSHTSDWFERKLEWNQKLFNCSCGNN